MTRTTARRLALAITLIRVPFGLVFLFWFVYGDEEKALAGLLMLLGVIELTDLLDGFIARSRDAVSELGAMLDPWADSVTRTIVYIALALGGRTHLALPLIMAMRDVTVAYARVVIVTHGGSAAARLSGKSKAWVQGVGAFALLGGPLFAATGSYYTAVSWIVGVVTVLSAVEYIVAAFRSLAAAESNGE